MSKIDQTLKLSDLVQEGVLVTTHALMKKGVTRSRINNWLRSGELVAEAHGVYRRPGPPLKWQAVVYSMQCMDEYDPLIGGLTALEIHGLSHYVNLSDQKFVHLYHRKRMPVWLDKIKTDAKFVLHHSKLFSGARGLTSAEWNPEKGITRNNNWGLQSTPWGNWDWPLTLSMPERAILEVLDGIPDEISFESANLLMQGLVNLSPDRLQKLLQDCKSVKDKRLFLWFAEHQNHAWFKRLDLSKVDLGEGKRMLVRGGKLDKKFMITVPRELYG